MITTYLFKAVAPSATDFTVQVEGDKIVKVDGIDEAVPRYFMRGGKGINGLVKAKVRTHTMKQMDVGTLGDGDGDGDGEEEETTVASGDVVKADSERQIVYGWAYTTHDKNGVLVIDKSGEFIDDPQELEDAAHKYVVKSRKGGADHARTGKNEVVQVGELVESMVFTKEKQEAMGIPPGVLPQCAWWVGIHVTDSAVWKRYKDKELTSFSIAGRAVRKEV